MVLWVLVASEPELSTFVTVPLAYKNLPDDLEISAEPVNSISLELRGPSGELRGFGESGRAAPGGDPGYDGRAAGRAHLPIGDGNVKLARGVRLVRAIPSEARFEFERRRDAHGADVLPRFAGEGHERLSRWRTSPWSRSSCRWSGRPAGWRASRRW